jgi:large subunit ribosomal protein L13
MNLAKEMKTYSTKVKDIERQWWLIDATGKTLGRVATEAASLLMGKHKPLYARYIDTGDYVVVINAAKVRVTGKKAEQKTYYRHSGYPGGLKSRSFKELFSKDPASVIELAVKGMLPDNRLGRAMFKKLRVYPGGEHQHQAQTSFRRPEQGEGRKMTEKKEGEILPKEG